MPAPKSGGLYKSKCWKDGFVEACPSRKARDGQGTPTFKLSHCQNRNRIDGYPIAWKNVGTTARVGLLLLSGSSNRARLKNKSGISGLESPAGETNRSLPSR
jgi:hypothetical protein